MRRGKTGQKKRKNRCIGILLLVALFFGEFSGGAIFGTQRTVRAEGGYYDVTQIPLAEGAQAAAEGELLVTSLEMTENKTTSVTLSWECEDGGEVSYLICQYDVASDAYIYLDTTGEKEYTCKNLTAGTEYYFTVSAWDTESSMQGAYCAPAQTYTKPKKMGEVWVTQNLADGISISWDAVKGAQGYLIFRADTAGEYNQIDVTEQTSYTDVGLTSGKTYRYKVCAYAFTTENTGSNSSALKTSTLPEQPVITVKGGKKKARITWEKITGASGYYLYRLSEDVLAADADTTVVTAAKGDAGDDISAGSESTDEDAAATEGDAENSGEAADAEGLPEEDLTDDTQESLADTGGEAEYQLVAVLEGKKSTEYIQENLTDGETVTYRVEAYRLLDENEYVSEPSVGVAATVGTKETVTAPKLYATKKKWKQSDAYKQISDFKNNVKYNKSVVIPGIDGTDVDGFYADSMCPQGLTIVDNYMLISAYDQNSEENSVIYVCDMTTGDLILTVVLPNQTHAGGITYDGNNIWVAQAKSVRCFPYADIKKAIKNGKSEVVIDAYTSVCKLTQQAGSLTYYKNRLWVASYDELNSGVLGAYNIKSKTGTPTLKLKASTSIPNRVQGIEFTTGGKLIFSRSCQTDANKRGFLHVLDVYKPTIKIAKGKITLGKLKNTVDMPSMNEEIAISGKYLYVNFESAAFSSAVQRMDRVCAFPTSALTKKKKSKE